MPTAEARSRHAMTPAETLDGIRQFIEMHDTGDAVIRVRSFHLPSGSSGGSYGWSVPVSELVAFIADGGYVDIDTVSESLGVAALVEALDKEGVQFERTPRVANVYRYGPIG